MEGRNPCKSKGQHVSVDALCILACEEKEAAVNVHELVT